MSSLSDGTGAPLAEVRTLFVQEFAALETGAKVRSYLTVLTTSRVRRQLRRRHAVAQLPDVPASARSTQRTA